MLPLLDLVAAGEQREDGEKEQEAFHNYNRLGNSCCTMFLYLASKLVRSEVWAP
jgi:hypothetical protein